MKLTAVLVLVFCQLQLLAGYPQGITLSLKDVRLPKVFREITKQTGYQFFYNDQMLEGAKTVSVELVNSTLVEALDLCFKDQPFTYTLDKKTVIVMRRKKNLSPEGLAITGKASPGGNESPPPVELRGKVINEKKEALIGASVKIKGIPKGTVTDSKGNFTIKADLGQTLVISYVGYDDREIIVSSDKNLTIEMELSLGSLLNTVVVNTGYQKVSKERYVGSFSQLDSTAYSRRVGMGIIERLDGMVPGIVFDKKSDLNPIQIRGISTLGGGLGLTSPLFNVLVVVDDFPFNGDVSMINPNDVENITILKDAAAASIWGSRAGNGVIVITTKKGKYNQPLHVSVSSNVTIQEKPYLYYYPNMSVADEIDVEQFLFSKGFYDPNLNNTTSWPVVSPVVELLAKVRSSLITQAEADARINSLKQVDLRNQLDKYVYRNAIAQQHYINLSGGNQQINYAFSAGYNYNLPNIQGSKGKGQYTLNFSSVLRPFKNFELQAGINYTQSEDKSNNIGFSNLYPYARLKDDLGEALEVPNRIRMGYLDTVGGGQLLDWKYRPLDEIRLADNSNISRLVLLNFGASYRFTNWLNAKISYQYTNQTTALRNYYSQQTWTARSLINSYTNLNQTSPDLRNPVPLGGILDLVNGGGNSHNVRGQFNINKNVGSKHAFTALAAAEISESRASSTNSNQFYGYNDENGTYKTLIDYVTPFPLYGGAGTRTIDQGNSYVEGGINRFISLIADASYTYNSLYTLYASARRDGANVFGGNTNARWKPLWSAGASWNISKEDFYIIKWMPSLTLRVSYGYTGNASSLATSLPVIFYQQLQPPTFLPRAQIGGAPNPDLKWEQVRTINLGIDFILLQSRLSGSLEFYNKKSTDLLGSVPFDPTAGIDLFTVNSASLKGHGFEFSLNSKNITGVFNWESSFHLSQAKTTVTKVYNGGFKAQDFINYNLNPAVGKPAYSMASYRWASLDPLTGDPQGWINGHVSKDYSAIFNDSVENQRFYGSSIPLYFGNLMNTFSWKHFSLSANITYRLGFYYRKPSINYSALFNSWIGNIDYEKRWQKPGDEVFTNIPSMVYPVPSAVAQRDQFYKNSEVNVLKGDNIRLQDVRLQYSWDNKNIRRISIKAVQIFVYANNLNLILWRAERSHFDPDFTGGMGSTTSTPTSRIWTGGININF